MRKFELHITKGNTTKKIGAFNSEREAKQFAKALPLPEGVEVVVREVSDSVLAIRFFMECRAFLGLDD